MSQLREYRFDDFVVDLKAWQLFHSGQVVHIEPTVLKLLVFLIENRDRLVTKREMLDTVWGGTSVSDSALSKAIARLRKALEDDPSSPRYIETVHALGYRFVAQVQDIDQPIENRPFRAKLNAAFSPHCFSRGCWSLSFCCLGRRNRIRYLHWQCFLSTT